MGTFRHTPDDIIFIDTSSYPLAWWITQEPAYLIPMGYTHRVYEQGVHHTLYDGVGQDPGDYPWTDGNTYISNKSTYDTAYDLYLNPPPTLPQAKTAKIEELDIYNSNKKTEKVIVNAITYKSTSRFFTQIFREFEKYTRDGSVPGGYYVRDDSETEQSLTLVQLEDVVDKIVDFWRDCDEVRDDHWEMIMALGTVAAVEAYDFTGGWPTTPYT